jgi:hypothetical protein
MALLKLACTKIEKKFINKEITEKKGNRKGAKNAKEKVVISRLMQNCKIINQSLMK